MPSDELHGVALVTGGGRGIGASIARELADAGMRVAVTARTREQVEGIAGEIGGIALVGDVSRSEDVEAWVERTEKELGPIDLLVQLRRHRRRSEAVSRPVAGGVVAGIRGEHARSLPLHAGGRSGHD